MTSERQKRAYWGAVELIAQACASQPDPDRTFHSIMDRLRLGRAHFNDIMDFGNHSTAYADWLGDAAETYDMDHWIAVEELVTYMAYRGDVLARVADIKREERRK